MVKTLLWRSTGCRFESCHHSITPISASFTYLCLASVKLKPYAGRWICTIKSFQNKLLTFADVLSNSGNATSRCLLKLLLCKENIILQHATTTCAIYLALLFISFHFCTAAVSALACHRDTQRPRLHSAAVNNSTSNHTQNTYIA